MTLLDNDKNKFDERVDQYLLGRMSEEEALQFEIEYLDKPELLAEVEMVEQLMVGLKLNAKADAHSISEQANAQPVASRKPTEQKESLGQSIKKFFDGFFIPQTAFGAAAAVALIIPLMLTTQGDINADTPVHTTSVYVLGQQRVRSVAAVPDANIESIELLAEQSSLTLGVEAEPTAGVPEPFTLKLYNDEDKLIWQQSELYPDHEWVVYVSLATTFITEGQYRYELESPVNKTKTGFMNIEKF
jgi:hypothetical protein